MPPYLDFSEALVAIKKGEIVKRKEWTGNNLFLGKKKIIRNNEVKEITAVMNKNVASGDFEIYNANHVDLMAEDWEIVE